MVQIRVVNKVPKNASRYLFDDKYDFIPNSDYESFDWLVVYDELPVLDKSESFVTNVPRNRSILVTVEPPTIKLYSPKYTNQFGHILTSHSGKFISDKSELHSLSGAIWWFVGKNPDELRRKSLPQKIDGISTFCSIKQQRHTRHYDRYNLTKYISENMPDLHWFGHGVNAVDDKFEAIVPYKYHIAVENDIRSGHWTEKVSDAILAGCLLFYAGDPDLLKDLPAQSFIPIPIDDYPEALKIIKVSMENNEYEKRVSYINEARELILNKLNFYGRVASIIESNTPSEKGAVSDQTRTIFGRHALRATWSGFFSEMFHVIRCKPLILRERFLRKVRK